MAGPHTARARARAAMLGDIRAVAYAQLSAEGSSGLSLRAVARELGVVPSALYRYHANRDELVTALVVDSYATLAAVVAGADGRAPRGAFRTRWTTNVAEVRRWARAEPARFQLLYGSPVPGYVAPAATIGPATSVVVALLAPVAESVAAGRSAGEPPAPGRVLGDQLEAVAAGLDVAIAPGLLARAVAAWAEVIGLVVLELGGHFVGGFEPADQLFDASAADQAARLGLRD